MRQVEIFSRDSNKSDSLPQWAKWVLGAIMLWCVFQAAFLIVAFSGGPPSQSAELVSTHNDSYYQSLLGFHIFGFLALGTVWITPGSMRRNLALPFMVLVSVIMLILATVFYSSIYQANSQIYIDLQKDQFFRRDIHLLPPGVKSRVISFVDADITTPLPKQFPTGALVKLLHDKTRQETDRQATRLH